MQRLGAILLCFFAPVVFAQSTQTGTGGAAATVDRYATAAAINVLELGGNAVDAAVVAAAVANVTNPFSVGIGGGGFMLVYLAGKDRVVTLDAREMAPAAATPDMFLDASGEGISFYPERVSSGLAVGVPGTLAGWDEALRRYGTFNLKTALQPAIKLAEEGFTVNETFAGQIADNAERFAAFSSTAKLFLPDGAPPEVGSTFRNPELAATLRLIAERGPEVLYQGELGRDLVRTVQNPPTVDNPPFTVRSQKMTMTDLDSYNVVVRDPTVTQYRNFTVYGMGPPSSGGLTVGLILNMLETSEMSTLPRPAALYRMLEAMRLAYADRGAYMGDSDFVNVPVTGLQAQGFADQRAALIKEQATLEVSAGNPFAFQDDPSPPLMPPARDTEGQSTTHIVTADAAGNAVSFTTTIEQTGGSGIVVPGRGFLLNNELTDFDSEPGGPNSVEPRKRPRSSMSPTIVTRNGKLYLAVGSPGGSTIITTVTQTLLNVFDFGMTLPKAINAPRLSNRGGESTSVETNVSPAPNLLKALEARGESFEETNEIGAATGILVRADGTLVAAAEKVRRGGGSARVVTPR